jgi:hypothetical protein
VGTVTDGRRIRCGVAAVSAADCRAFFEGGDVVVLRAIAGEGARFGGWGGAFCSGLTRRCDIRVSAAKTVSAFFRRD